ncbi:MAG: orotidine 5'-phosphate decarboxylase [Candidatus Taylorbacteria bacterium]|nr:orotidine 5'-phosphate decarboxylase [Candidatus Taylorbacteria bacterium]
MNIPNAERLVVAADFTPDATGREGVRKKVLVLAEELKGMGVVIKVNSILRACGYGLIRQIHDLGLRVAADLKLVDIKNTLETDGALLAEEKPEFLTVMANVGVDGMSAVRAALPGTEVWAVTVLTTFDDQVSSEIFGCTADEAVLRFARLAKSAGIPGLILSPKEGKIIRADANLNGLRLNSPGIRYPWAEVKKDDQVRFLPAGEAVASGIDRVVVGRPILNAGPNDDPTKPKSRREAAEWILRDIAENLANQEKGMTV